MIGARAPHLFVVAECYPRPGVLGHCAFAHRQLAGVARAGWDVEALIPNGWYPAALWPLAPAWRVARARHVPAGWSVDGVPVRDLAYQNRVPSRLCRPLDAGARVAAALDETLRRAARPRRDLVLSQFALPYGPAVRDACRRNGLPYAVSLRGDDVWIWPHQREDRMQGFRDTVRDAALVVAVSRTILDEARRISDHPLPRAAVVPNGVDLSTFRPPREGEREQIRAALGIEGSARVVLCVAAAIARKGWRELLAAVGRLGDDVVLLAAVPAHEPDVDLERESAELAPSLRMIVRSDVRAEELATLHRAADIFCLASYGEGMSNAVLEAMASGLPIVTTPVGGHPEVIANGREGLLVAPRETEPLREALAVLLGDESLRAAMGAAARRRAEAVGDSSAAGRRLAGLFAQTVDGTLPDPLPWVDPYMAHDEVTI